MLVLLFMLISLFPLSADQIEPSEPDIVLPEVILQIEDLSVDIVEAGLPPEEDLLPPERDIPLPEESELHIEEPSTPQYFTESKSLFLAEAGRGYSLSAEGILGLGSMNHIFSSIALYRIGEEPRFKLKFLHEMLDGLSGQPLAPPGAGFHQREDRLEGNVRFHLGRLGIEIDGTWLDLERGLQGPGLQDQGLQGPFESRIYRHGNLALDLEYPLQEWFRFGGELDTAYSVQLLTGTSPDETLEFLIGPELWGRLIADRFWLELRSRYKARLGWGKPLHRIAVDGLLGLELSRDFTLAGRVGWMWNSPLDHLVPFELVLTGTPISSLVFRLSGGYRVEELDYQDVLNEYDWVVLPKQLYDNHGWFGDLGVSFNIIRDFSIQGRGVFSWNSNLLDPSPDPSTGLDDTYGLFPLEQREGVFRLSSQFGIKWNIANLVTLRAGLDSEFLERPGFTPQHQLLIAGEGAEPKARWGGSVALGFLFGHTEGETEGSSWSYSPIPELSLSGFFKISDSVTLIGEGQDLLSPFIDGGRDPWYPFQEAGIRGTLKFKINM